MWPLNVRDLYGCGAATAQQLNDMGFRTIGDLASCSEQMLKNLLGEKRGEYIYRRVEGSVFPGGNTAAGNKELFEWDDHSERAAEEKATPAMLFPLSSQLSRRVSERLKKEDGYLRNNMLRAR